MSLKESECVCVWVFFLLVFVSFCWSMSECLCGRLGMKASMRWEIASIAFKDCEILLLPATFAFICCCCCFAVCAVVFPRGGRGLGRLQYGEEFVGFVSCPLFPNQLLHYNTYTIPSAEGP